MSEKGCVSPCESWHHLFLCLLLFLLCFVYHFQIYNVVLLTVVTGLYITSPRTLFFYNRKFLPFYHLRPFHHAPPSPPCFWKTSPDAFEPKSVSALFSYVKQREASWLELSFCHLEPKSPAWAQSPNFNRMLFLARNGLQPESDSLKLAVPTPGEASHGTLRRGQDHVLPTSRRLELSWQAPPLEEAVIEGTSTKKRRRRRTLTTGVQSCPAVSFLGTTRSPGTSSPGPGALICHLNLHRHNLDKEAQDLWSPLPSPLLEPYSSLSSRNPQGLSFLAPPMFPSRSTAVLSSCTTGPHQDPSFTLSLWLCSCRV